ncbi:ABC transporter permease [Chloroflexota bacterium]
MTLLSIVGKDISRRKRRVIPVSLGVAVGIMAVIGTLTIANAGEVRLRAELEKYGPNLSIQPATGSLDMRIGSLDLGAVVVGDNYISEAVLQDIQQIADDAIREEMGVTDEGTIATVAPRLYMPTAVGSVPATLTGVWPTEERAIRSWWAFDDGRHLEDDREIVAGAFAATALDLKTGDTLELEGRQFVVVGTLQESGANDDYLLFASLSTVQELFARQGYVSTVDVRALCTACPVEMIADSINGAVPGIHAVAVRQVAEAEMMVQERLRTMMLSLAAVTLAVGLFGVANALSAMVAERTKDIGIMRAVGASRSQIVRVLLYEAVVLGLLGGIAGYVGGLGLAAVVGPIVFDAMRVEPVGSHVPLALALAVAVSLLAALRPSLVAARTRVADTLRTA